MAKTDWKAEAKRLKRKVVRLRDQLATGVDRVVEATEAAVARAAKPVSPLAPAGGFPALPHIAGVEFSAVEAGVRYQNRRDVMLVRLAPGTVWRATSERAPSAPITTLARTLAGAASCLPVWARAW